MSDGWPTFRMQLLGRRVRCRYVCRGVEWGVLAPGVHDDATMVQEQQMISGWPRKFKDVIARRSATARALKACRP
jgi:hypothetical protein